jgi:hypothetical protein
MPGETVTVEYTPVSGPLRRLRFVPQLSRDGHWRVTEVYLGCHWRETGPEPVSELVVPSGTQGEPPNQK